MGDFRLPPSEKPWVFRPYGSAIIFISEEHPPLIFADGKLQPLDFSGDQKKGPVAVRQRTSVVGGWIG